MIYSSFAQVYDRLMDQSLYQKWRDYVLRHVQPQGQSLLELACGSGTLAVQLSQAGFNVTGFDLSSEMLTLANQKAIAAKLDLPLIQGDMRDLSGLPSFDIVTCFDDSLCYMKDLTDVRKVFQQVYNLLPQTGYFMFDAHSLYQMDEVFPGYMFNDRTEDTAFMWSSYCGDEPHSIEHDLTFFVWDERIKGYQAFNELHYERTYPLTDFEKALHDVGFRKIEITSNFGLDKPQEHSQRWFFTVQK